MNEAAQFSIVPRFVWQGCQPSEVAVYCALASRVDWETGVCWPSRTTIAKDASVSLSTVKRALRKLVEVGAIEIERRTSEEGDHASNLYRLPFAINRRGGVTGDPTSGHTRPGGRVASDPLTRSKEREGLTPSKTDPDLCRHLPIDEDGYCTACGFEEE